MSRLFTNATSDKIVPGSGVPDLTSVWTIAAWVNRSRASGTDILDMIWARLTNSTTNRQVAIYIGTGSASRIQVDIPFIASILTGDTVVAHDGWHHIAVIRNGTTWVVYLDGDLDGVTTNATSQETGGPVELGASTALGNTYTLDGMLAEVGAWDVALDPAEIAQLQTQSPVYVRPADLVGAWRLTGTASPEPDSVSTNHGTVTGTSQGSSNPPISYNPPALFRGRNFAFFDDEEVNRFEFWPAVSEGATTHERSAALDASVAIAGSGEFFSIFSAALTVDVSASVTSAGARVVDRSISLNSSVSVDSIGEFFSVFTSSAAIAATGAIGSSATFFSVFEQSVVLDGIASISITGARVVDRNVSVSVTAAIESSGEAFTLLERTAVFDGQGAIESAGQFFSIFERQLVLDGAAVITVTGQSEFQRQVLLSTTADISASGIVLPPGAVEHNRSVVLDMMGLIAASGHMVSERSVDIATAVSISVNHQRDLSRAVVVAASGGIEANSTFFSTLERVVSISVNGGISISAGEGYDFRVRKVIQTSRESHILGISRERRIA